MRPAPTMAPAASDARPRVAEEAPPPGEPAAAEKPRRERAPPRAALIGGRAAAVTRPAPPVRLPAAAPTAVATGARDAIRAARVTTERRMIGCGEWPCCDVSTTDADSPHVTQKLDAESVRFTKKLGADGKVSPLSPGLSLPSLTRTPRAERPLLTRRKIRLAPLSGALSARARRGYEAPPPMATLAVAPSKENLTPPEGAKAHAAAVGGAATGGSALARSLHGSALRVPLKATTSNAPGQQVRRPGKYGRAGDASAGGGARFTRICRSHRNCLRGGRAGRGRGLPRLSLLPQRYSCSECHAPLPIPC